METAQVTRQIADIRTAVNDTAAALRAQNPALVITHAAQAVWEAELLELCAIDAARATGTTWAVIAEALSLTSQGAQQRRARLAARFGEPA